MSAVRVRTCIHVSLRAQRPSLLSTGVAACTCEINRVRGGGCRVVPPKPVIKVIKCAGPSSCCQRHSLGPCRSEHSLQGKFGLDVARAELLRRVRPFLFASCLVCIGSFCTESLTFAVSLPELRKVNLLVRSSGTLDPRTNSDMSLDDSFCSVSMPGRQVRVVDGSTPTWVFRKKEKKKLVSSPFHFNRLQRDFRVLFPRASLPLSARRLRSPSREMGWV